MQSLVDKLWYAYIFFSPHRLLQPPPIVNF